MGQVSSPRIVSEANVTVSHPVTLHQLAAVFAAFNIPELLKWILKYLSFELLDVRAIDNHFRDIIDQSPKLRKAMFRRADMTTASLTLPDYGIRSIAYRISHTRRGREIRVVVEMDGASYSTVYERYL